jgi:hypothetical protein
MMFRKEGRVVRQAISWHSNPLGKHKPNYGKSKKEERDSK